MTIAETTYTVAEDGCVHLDWEDLVDNPLAVYDAVRPLSAAIKAGHNYYIIRGPDVLQLFNDPRVQQFEVQMMGSRGYPTDGYMYEFNLYAPLMANGDVHKRRRGALQAAFTRPNIEKMRPHIRKEINRLVDAFPVGEDFDFLDYLASPTPGRIISWVVGLDPDNWERFAYLVYEMTQGMAPPFNAERFVHIEDCAKELLTFVEEVMADRRHCPQEDWVTGFIQSCDETGALSELEIRSQIASVLLAGSDTTRGALREIMGLLLEHPDQWQTLCANPDQLLMPAITEGLRFEPPVVSTPRMAVEDFELDGAQIKKGTPVELMTMSAMRDPAVYENPNSFNIRRNDGPRLVPAFGGGPHRCVGEFLARMELEEAFRAIIERYPDIRLVGENRKPKGWDVIRECQPLMVHIPA